MPSNGGVIGPVIEPSAATSENLTAFTSNGTFTAQSNQTSATVLLVAGGGGGGPTGPNEAGGGGPI